MEILENFCLRGSEKVAHFEKSIYGTYLTVIFLGLEKMEREKQKQVEKQKEMKEREKLMEQRKKEEEEAYLELQREKNLKKIVS